MHRSLYVFVLGAGLLVLLAACSTPAATPAATLPPPTSVPPSATPVPPSPTVASSRTPVPTATAAPVVDNCLKCHTDPATLQKLAVDKTVKSEQTKGEG